MKIALCTCDFFFPVQESLRDSGHQLVRVYTSCPLNTGFSDKTFEFAKEMKAEFRECRVTEQDLNELASNGVELLVSAAYDFKIPTPTNCPIKFVNVHGSMLPDGRGPWPQPWLLLKYPELAGVTYHSMTQDWDRGDIVLQRNISLSMKDDLDSLIGKTLVCVKELSTELFKNFHQLWRNRLPMRGAGSYWKKPTVVDRTITVTDSVEKIFNIFRAFGESTFFRDPQTSTLRPVRKLTSWKSDDIDRHKDLIAVSPPRFVYAAADGYISLVFSD